MHFFFLARATDSSYDPTWLRIVLSWMWELGSVLGRRQSTRVESACLPHALLTEEDWVGACEHTLLPEVLPCLLATRLAWKRTHSGHRCLLPQWSLGPYFPGSALDSGQESSPRVVFLTHMDSFSMALASSLINNRLCGGATEHCHSDSWP